MTDFKIKQLHKDPDAIVLIVAALVMVALPADMFAQVIDRLQHPIVGGLIALATGGRFWVRGKSVEAAGVEAAVTGGTTDENWEELPEDLEPWTTATDVPGGELA